MKIITQDNIYSLLPKLNLFMSVCAVVLSVFLALSLLRPYNISRNLIIKPAGYAKLFLPQEPKVAFKDELFKRVQLFNESVQKKAPEAKVNFILLGVSMGEKKLAMIRDIVQNKDYYCAQGDMIGEFKVKQISKDKVILESQAKILEINR